LGERQIKVNIINKNKDRFKENKIVIIAVSGVKSNVGVVVAIILI